MPALARTTKSDQVRELQRTLYRAAKADPERRFHALHDKVYRRDVLERAWESVRANHGAAGIDQTTIADVEQYGVSRLLDELAADLGDGRWRPLPARRVFIPKPGREELRQLSIPAVRDRVVQAALKSVIEPIFEADMLECSFGFRPRGSAHDALQVLIDESWRGNRWVAKSDIADCFEAIPHSGLMTAIEERISDRHVLKLLRAMLRVGVMEDGAVRRSVSGTPQGGVISPVLGVRPEEVVQLVEASCGRLVADGAVGSSVIVEVEPASERGVAFAACAGSRPRWPSLPIPIRVRMPETVESAISSASAISAPVNRTRRNAAIASTRRSSVRLATTAGADDRSNRPASPSARWRASHLRAVWSLIPAAAAASISDHTAPSTRSTNNSRPFTLRRALACNFIRCPPWCWWLRHQPASKEARMNNLLRNYT